MRQKITDAPIIEALKPYKEFFNVKYSLNLPPDSAFGNLTLSWWELVIRFECVNDLIVQLYEEFYILKRKILGTQMSDEGETYRQKFYTEQIFYWLRKSADEIISIFSLLNDVKTYGNYPVQIKCSSIGNFLSGDPFDATLEKHRKLLEILNEISNGFKHSFINSQIHSLHGSEYPVVFAYTLHFNKRSNKAKFHALDLKGVLRDYNLFLSDAKQSLIDNYGAGGFSFD
jgi:hypothetical protein